MDNRISDFLFAQFGIAGLVVVGLAFVLYRLSADFAKLRTELQHELTRDLINKRFAAYDTLWASMRPLAAYSDEPLTSDAVRALSKTLSDWYFSEDGGMFLTVRNREFYFALQDLLRVASALPAWACERRPARQAEALRKLVDELPEAREIAGFDAADLKQSDTLDPRVWRALCRALGGRLESMAQDDDPRLADTAFIVLQQASSVLRSNLAQALNSRLEAHGPKP
jgi:hypothetical protein